MVTRDALVQGIPSGSIPVLGPIAPLSRLVPGLPGTCGQRSSRVRRSIACAGGELVRETVRRRLRTGGVNRRCRARARRQTSDRPDPVAERPAGIRAAVRRLPATSDGLGRALRRRRASRTSTWRALDGAARRADDRGVPAAPQPAPTSCSSTRASPFRSMPTAAASRRSSPST